MSDLDATSCRETDWFVGDARRQVLHSAPTKRECLEWIAEKDRLFKTPAGHQLTDGIWQVATPDGTYWVMRDAPLARQHGYDIPHPEGHDPFGLDKGTCALFDREAGPALVWNRDGHIGQQPVPALKIAVADEWAERQAVKLRSLGVTTYLGRKEIAS